MSLQCKTSLFMRRQKITKTCTICQSIKDENEFRKNRLQCNKCLNMRRVLSEKKKKKVKSMFKECTICLCFKEEKEFRKNRLQCKKCLSIRRALLEKTKKKQCYIYSCIHCGKNAHFNIEHKKVIWNNTCKNCDYMDVNTLCIHFGNLLL